MKLNQLIIRNSASVKLYIVKRKDKIYTKIYKIYTKPLNLTDLSLTSEAIWTKINKHEPAQAFIVGSYRMKGVIFI